MKRARDPACKIEMYTYGHKKMMIKERERKKKNNLLQNKIRLRLLCSRATKLRNGKVSRSIIDYCHLPFVSLSLSLMNSELFHRTLFPFKTSCSPFPSPQTRYKTRLEKSKGKYNSREEEEEEENR